MTASQSMFDRREFLRFGISAVAALAFAPGAAPFPAAASQTETVRPVGTLATSTQSTGPLTDVTFQLSWVKDSEWASSFIADDRGYYRDEGLNVNLESGGPDIDNLLPVVNENALVTTRNSLSVATARSKGAPLTIIGAVMQKNPFAVLSLKSKPIRRPKDLEGKRFGVSNINATVYQAFVKLTKIDASKITVVPVQFDAAPLVSGEVDAFLTFGVKLPVQLELKGIPVTYFLFSDYGYVLYNQCYTVRQESLKTKRDVLTHFMRAEIRGWQDNQKDPSIAARLTVEKYGKSLGLDYQAELRTNQLTVARLLQSRATREHGLLWMGDDDIAANIRTFEASGLTGVGKELFTNEILQEVYRGRTRI